MYGKLPYLPRPHYSRRPGSGSLRECLERPRRRGGRTYPGEDLMDVAPETSDEATLHAAYVIGHIEAANKMPLAALYSRRARPMGSNTRRCALRSGESQWPPPTARRALMPTPKRWRAYDQFWPQSGHDGAGQPGFRGSTITSGSRSITGWACDQVCCAADRIQPRKRAGMGDHRP